MSFYDYCTGYFVRHLEHDIEAHEAGHFAEIGLAFNDAPDWTLDEEKDREGFERLAIVYSFWDYWIDARNHDWRYYRGVEAEDWPLIARQMCRGLREKWPPERMEDNAVFNPPPAPPREGFWRQLKRVFARE